MVEGCKTNIAKSTVQVAHKKFFTVFFLGGGGSGKLS